MFALGILQYELWKKGAGSSADCKEFRNGRNIKPIRGEKRASNKNSSSTKFGRFDRKRNFE